MKSLDGEPTVFYKLNPLIYGVTVCMFKLYENNKI